MKYVISRNFSYLWFGRIISQLGDKFYAIALTLWVLEYLQSPGAMGLYLASTMLPGILLGIFSGPVTDRCNRKMLLIAADVARGLVIFGVLALSVSGGLTFGAIIAASVLLSLASSVFETSAQAMIPQIVKESMLPRANSLNQLVAGVLGILGPALGAAAVVLMGYDVIFLANAVSFLFSALLEAFLDYRPDRRQMKAKSMLADLGEGFRYLGASPDTLLIIWVVGIAHFFVGSLNVALPFLAENIGGNTKHNLGWLEAAIGAGLTLGAVWMGLRRGGTIKKNWLFVCLFAAGLCYAGLGVLCLVEVTSLLFYLALIVMIGLAIVIASILWQSTLQSGTPQGLAGRVFSLSSLAGNLSLPLSFGIYGVLLQHFSLKGVLLSTGIGLAATTPILFAIGLNHRNQKTVNKREPEAMSL